ncbi:SAICAR synthase-like protein [Jaminaea rosea]|uniref:Kinase n=1 Tax=Jaminaea rosea TaxID=1569628 RepID=A0A316UWL0_9BASI|nr:SAICAR synthase-like protein [Jaminaea rosea]PWN29188.1 SAICAR synthase-like protein [Jaminaea rosea]
MQDWSKLKVAELKEELTSRSLPTNGLKAELVARLAEADSSSSAAPEAKEENGAEVADEAEVTATDEPPETEGGAGADTVQSGDKPRRTDADGVASKKNVEEEPAIELLQAPAEEPAPTEEIDLGGEAAAEQPKDSAIDATTAVTTKEPQPTEGKPADSAKPASSSLVTSEWLISQLSALNASHTNSPSSQIAGHPGTVRSLTGPSGEAMVVKQTLPAEVDFYASHLHASGKLESETNKGQSLRKQMATRWTPRFYGSATVAEGEKPYVALEDLLSGGFEKANVLDVKLGTQLWDEMDASHEKQERMEAAAKATTSAETGIRLTSWRTWDSQAEDGAGQFRSMGKAFGKAISADQLPLGLTAFFGLLRGKEAQEFEEIDQRAAKDAVAVADAAKSPVLEGPTLISSTPRLPFHLVHPLLTLHLLPQLDRLIGLMSQLEVRIRGGSLLVVFEGELNALWRRMSERAIPPAKGDEAEEKKEGEDQLHDAKTPKERKRSPPLVKLRLIDFAHSRFVPGQGPDEGLLKGLRTLRALLGHMVEDVVPISQVSIEEAAQHLPAARVLRVEGLVRPMTLALLKDKCKEILAQGEGQEDPLDTTVLDGGAWLDGIKSCGWLVFRTTELAMKLQRECDGSPFPPTASTAMAVDEAAGRPSARFYPVAEPSVDTIVTEYVPLEERAWKGEKRERLPLLVRKPKSNNDEADKEGLEWPFLLRLAHPPSNESAGKEGQAASKKDSKKRKGQDPVAGVSNKRADRGQGTTIRGIAGRSDDAAGAALMGRMGGFTSRDGPRRRSPPPRRDVWEPQMDRLPPPDPYGYYTDERDAWRPPPRGRMDEIDRRDWRYDARPIPDQYAAPPPPPRDDWRRRERDDWRAPRDDYAYGRRRSRSPVDTWRRDDRARDYSALSRPLPEERWRRDPSPPPPAAMSRYRQAERYYQNDSRAPPPRRDERDYGRERYTPPRGATTIGPRGDRPPAPVATGDRWRQREEDVRHRSPPRGPRDGAGGKRYAADAEQGDRYVPRGRFGDGGR